MNETILKYFMIMYFLLYYGVLFVLNSYLVYKRTGKNPYVLGKSKGILSFTENGIKITGIIIPLIVIIFILSQEIYQWLVPIEYLEKIYLNLIGISIMLLGFVICLTAHFYMRSSWRIGIDVDDQVKLITAGIFKYSRNPFFLGTFFSYLGFFLVLPNILSFTVGVVYFILIQIQVRLEEENLNKSLGGTYENYCSNVKRWI
ncbi:MAG: isoprenylcysteine carboxylmethyltransferase family protein [Melioribacteraceae bacterium]|nr:isoprenylcysteine carboxylmethyltransferase family protein [Melioribacteraceae bacterium]